MHIELDVFFVQSIVLVYVVLIFFFHMVLLALSCYLFLTEQSDSLMEGADF